MTIAPTAAAATTHAGEVRQRILDGATRAFSRSGPQATSVPEIAAECGVSVGLLYRYFSSKAELYAAICWGQTEAVASGLQRQLEQIPDPRRRVEHALDLFLDHLAEAGGATLILGAMAEAPTNPGVRGSLQSRRDAIRAFIEAFLRDLAAAGELRPEMPVKEYATSIAMMLDGALADWAVSDPGGDTRGAREAILATLSGLLGLTQDPGGTAERA